MLVLILVFIALNYIGNIIQDRLGPRFSKEGFENPDALIAGALGEENGVIRWLSNDDLYDDFYVSVYDQLTQGSVRNQAEVGLMLHEWTKRGDELKTFNVLDVGCGSGIAVCAFAKMGVARVVGMDKSDAMLKQAKTKTLPQTTLTDKQKDVIEWRKADVANPSACTGGEFDHICMMYFTIYYINDKEGAFRNMYFWTKPGGRLVVQVVNKHKFDPMLESSTPWIGFSLQKYTDKRITSSEVTFDKFKYKGEFDLQDPGAEFRETFRFEGGKVRRQRHTLKMDDMSEIVGMAKLAGWEYLGFTDLTPISFEYAYHLHFKRS